MISSDRGVCAGMGELMGGALSGEASASEIDSLEEHLRNCSRCASVYGEVSAFRARLLDAYAFEAPATREAAPHETTPSEGVHPKQKRFDALRFLAAAGMAATVLLALALHAPAPAPEPLAPLPVETAVVRNELSVYVSGEFDMMGEDELLQYLSEDEMEEVLESMDEEFQGV